MNKTEIIFYVDEAGLKVKQGRLRATIFISVETVHLILSYYLGDAVSGDLKMVAFNRSLSKYIQIVSSKLINSK